MGTNINRIIERNKAQQAREGYAPGLSEKQIDSLKRAEERALQANTRKAEQDVQERVARTRDTILGVHSKHGPDGLPIKHLQAKENSWVARLQWDKERGCYALTSGNRGIVVFINQNPRDGIIIERPDTHVIHVRVVGSGRSVIKTVVTDIGLP